MENVTYVGMDVHKRFHQVAMLVPGRETPVEWRTETDARGIRRLIRRLEREGDGVIHVAYEAGPCGYGLQRTLEAHGIACTVVAPSLIPKKPGERIKTDRRDARKLAELLRADVLTAVMPPTPEEEAARDLFRAREDARQDLARARHRLGKWLLRHEVRYTRGKNAWTKAYHTWLRTLRLDDPTAQAVFDAYRVQVEQRTETLRGLEETLTQLAQQPKYAGVVGALRCFRGVDTLTAIGLVVELFDFGRFDSPRGLMSYLGLVPSEHSTGGNPHRGAITKTGNRVVRRLAIEAAWHARHPVHVSRALAARRQGQPSAVVSIADQAMARLHRRYWRLVGRGKPTHQAAVAVARELVGFLWAVLYPYAVGAAPTPDGNG
jgi:transposase